MFSRLMAWLRKPSEKTVTPYKIVDRGLSQLSSWLITEGPYQGVECLIGNVEIGDGQLDFSYDVLANPNNKNVDDQTFLTVIGDILHYHISTQKNEMNHFLCRKD